MFQCEFSYNRGLAFVVMEVTFANGTAYVGTCNSSRCSGPLALAYDSHLDNAVTVHVNILTLRSLTEEYNNSQVTCSLWFASVIQWKNTTTVTIFPQMKTTVANFPQSEMNTSTVVSLQNTSLSSTTRCPMYCKAVVGGLVSGAAFVVALVFIVLVLFLKRNKSDISPKSKNLQNLELDVTCGSTVTLPLSNAATTSAEYSNLACTSLTSLVIANRRTKSMSEIFTRDKFEIESQRIYISCSEKKVIWVTEHLKPLVQRLFVGCEVIIPSDSMLAGHPITEERMRLISETDKILVVCSPEYESSQWCQYELQQFVSKDPSLLEGRIVSILCDGCSDAPRLISGVESIHVDDAMFESKLGKSIAKPMFVVR